MEFATEKNKFNKEKLGNDIPEFRKLQVLVKVLWKVRQRDRHK